MWRRTESRFGHFRCIDFQTPVTARSDCDEAIQFALAAMDCFACARDGGVGHAVAFPRRARRPGLAKPCPSWIEGAGNAGCSTHPQPRAQRETSTRAKSPRSHRFHPAFPARMVLTAYSVISPAIGLSCHRHRRKVISANLIPASRHQDHTASPSAINAFVLCVIASIASRAQRVVTIAKRPSLSGTG